MCKKGFQRAISLTLLAVLIMGVCLTGTGCTSKQKLYIFNWGDYIAPEILDLFEAEYPQYDVIYDNFDTNETMYQKLRLVADLDKIQPILERVFMDLTNMRNMLDHACDDVIASNEQKKTMIEIRDTFDGFNSTIFKEIIPKLDSLAITEGAHAKFEK